MRFCSVKRSSCKFIKFTRPLNSWKLNLKWKNKSKTRNWNAPIPWTSNEKTKQILVCTDVFFAAWFLWHHFTLALLSWKTPFSYCHVISKMEKDYSINFMALLLYQQESEPPNRVTKSNLSVQCKALVLFMSNNTCFWYHNDENMF